MQIHCQACMETADISDYEDTHSDFGLWAKTLHWANTTYMHASNLSCLDMWLDTTLEHLLVSQSVHTASPPFPNSQHNYTIPQVKYLKRYKLFWSL